MLKSCIKLITLTTLVLVLASCSSTVNKKDIKAIGNSVAPQLTKAYKAYDEGRLSTAETLFLQYLKKYPNYAEGWFKLGNIYYRTGKYAAAVTAYENVIQQNEKHGKAWYNLALTRIKQAELTLESGEVKFEPGSQQRLKLTELKNKIRSGVRQYKPKKKLK